MRKPARQQGRNAQRCVLRPLLTRGLLQKVSSCDTLGCSGQDLHRKDRGKILGQPVFDLGHIDLTAEQFVHRRHGLAFAGDDPVVIAQIRVHVEGKAVGRNPAFNVNADGGDLAFGRVDAGQVHDAECLDPEIRHRTNEHFFKIADVFVHVLAVGREADYRVADDLSQAVISDLAAAVSFENFDAEILQYFSGRKHAVFLRTTADRKCMRMFQKQQMIAFTLRNYLCFKYFLKFERISIGNPAQASNFQTSLPHILMIKCLANIEQAGRIMRTGRYLTILAILALAALPAAAQRKGSAKPKPTPTPVKMAVNPVVAAAKQQVSNQLYNVNVFVDKMGPIAISIENMDREASARRLKKEEIDANDLNKKRLVAAIRGLRDGLMALETDFRTKPQLSQYLSRIQGISTLCAQSEDNAIAGRFVASKDPLRQVTVKLNDTLAVLPGMVMQDRPTNMGTTAPVPASMNQTRTVSNQTVSTNQPVSSSKRDAAVGMTASEVLASTWGAPMNKRTSNTQNGTTEVWFYSGTKTIYFFNGKVTRIIQ